MTGTNAITPRGAALARPYVPQDTPYKILDKLPLWLLIGTAVLLDKITTPSRPAPPGRPKPPRDPWHPLPLREMPYLQVPGRLLTMAAGNIAGPLQSLDCRRRSCRVPALDKPLWRQIAAFLPPDQREVLQEVSTVVRAAAQMDINGVYVGQVTSMLALLDSPLCKQQTRMTMCAVDSGPNAYPWPDSLPENLNALHLVYMHPRLSGGFGTALRASTIQSLSLSKAFVRPMAELLVHLPFLNTLTLTEWTCVEKTKFAPAIAVHPSLHTVNITVSETSYSLDELTRGVLGNPRLRRLGICALGDNLKLASLVSHPGITELSLRCDADGLKSLGGESFLHTLKKHKALKTLMLGAHLYKEHALLASSSLERGFKPKYYQRFNGSGIWAAAVLEALRWRGQLTQLHLHQTFLPVERLEKALNGMAITDLHVGVDGIDMLWGTVILTTGNKLRSLRLDDTRIFSNVMLQSLASHRSLQHLHITIPMKIDDKLQAQARWKAQGRPASRLILQ